MSPLHATVRERTSSSWAGARADCSWPARLAGEASRAGLRRARAVGDPVHCTGVLAADSFDDFDLPARRDPQPADHGAFSRRRVRRSTTHSHRRCDVVDRGTFDRALATRASRPAPNSASARACGARSRRATASPRLPATVRSARAWWCSPAAPPTACSAARGSACRPVPAHGAARAAGRPPARRRAAFRPGHRAGRIRVGRAGGATARAVRAHRADGVE